MRYEPYQEEYDAAQSMSDEDLLEYFMYRIVEMDEVWGLKESRQWILRVVDGHETLPVWPYRRYADEAAVGDWENMIGVAETLDFFMYQVLNKLTAQGVLVEIMPRKSAAGCLISPQRLFSFLEGMRDSRDFVLDD